MTILLMKKKVSVDRKSNQPGYSLEVKFNRDWSPTSLPFCKSWERLGSWKWEVCPQAEGRKWIHRLRDGSVSTGWGTEVCSQHESVIKAPASSAEDPAGIMKENSLQDNRLPLGWRRHPGFIGNEWLVSTGRLSRERQMELVTLRSESSFIILEIRGP